MANPWAIVAVLVILGATNTATALFFKGVGRDSVLAEQAADAEAQAEAAAQRQRDAETIGTAVASATAAALHQNAGSSNESVERIRTVVVPAECRDVDAASLHELRTATAAANRTLGDGLRSLAPGTGAGDPGHAP